MGPDNRRILLATVLSVGDPVRLQVLFPVEAGPPPPTRAGGAAGEARARAPRRAGGPGGRAAGRGPGPRRAAAPEETVVLDTPELDAPPSRATAAR